MNKSIVIGSQQDIANKQGISLAESFLNAEIVVILDNSGSMGNTDTPQGISRVELAQQHLNTLQGKNPGKVALICFGSEVTYSPSGMIVPVGGSTDLANALQFAKIADGCGLKIVVISDGEPNDESRALAVARTYTTKIDVIYCGSESDYRGRDFLQRLARATGGQFFTSDNPGELLQQTEMLLLGG